MSLDQDLIDAAEAAVAAGSAPSVSAWVADAMTKHSEHHQRLEALREFIADWEAEFGEITEEEMRAQVRRAKEETIVVRGGRIYRPEKRESK